ncbi:MAG: hypothetical protein F2793_10250 [Actinobacteria bacterium]|uniref:Unannotated protein n=1 Tax=freshwater metagenome TaxID=449393 RepID=A0A6J7EXH6_9ZZZZ|nr:hypothetical protein [Actinomycetota bacterium]
MTVIVVEEVMSGQDIARLIAYLSEVLANGEAEDLCGQETVRLTKRPGIPSAEALEEFVDLYGDDECYDADHRDDCSCRRDAADSDPRWGVLVQGIRSCGPVLYVACPSVGTHGRLSDCWMCWGDVMRGVIEESEAVTPAPRVGER